MSYPARTSRNSKNELVLHLESDVLAHSRLTKLSFRKDHSYLTGRAGLIRICNFLLSTISILLLFPGYFPVKLNPNDETQHELIRQMGNRNDFSGYNKSKYTNFAIVLGGCCALISLTFIILLFLFIEVRRDGLWEKVNQKTQVIACILSVLAGFCDVVSIQEIQVLNCRSLRCREEVDNTKITKYEEEFYPPNFFSHYAAFVLFLANAMLYSIASRIWLRNED